MTYRILVTGTRETLTPAMEHEIWRAMDDACSIVPLGDRITIVHGDCPTGVDAYVEQRGHRDFVGAVTERHPADWAAHGRGAGPIRNKHMVDLGADVCLAFPHGASRGTRGCAALAVAAGIPTTVVEL